MTSEPVASASPASLEHLRAHEGGDAWLTALPDLVRTAAERWQLTLRTPYDDVYESMTFPAERADGSTAVLKVAWPNRESTHVAEALRRWNGDGAVRLLDDAPDLGALLLERCDPGTPLSEVGLDEALDVLADLIRRLSVPIGAPFATLADEAAILSAELESEWLRTDGPFERRLVDAALDAFAGLAPTQGLQVLVNQDLHADNVLRARRQPWLVIDPKPLAGEREFAIAPVVRSRELGHSRQAVLRRFDRLTSDLGLDRERARGWTIAHAIAWSFEGDGVIQTHVETARWLLDAIT
jgi:streptomycin 6-kinase